MTTENLSILEIHKLTQAQYDRELAAGTLNEHAFYLTPDEDISLESLGVITSASELNYVDGVTSNIQEQLNDKVDKIEGKGLSTNDYTTEEKEKLASLTASAEITIADINEICGSTIYSESEVTY